MNKEKEALLKAIQAEPDVPKKVATKNLLQFIERMQPETLEMRNFLIAKFSAETRAESRAISEAWYAKMTPIEQQAFAKAYHRCCMNELENSKKVRAKLFVGELAPSVSKNALNQNWDIVKCDNIPISFNIPIPQI